MSKLIPFLFAGVGASSVSVGGVFMLKKTGGNGVSEGQKSSDNTNGNAGTSGKPTQEKKLVFEDVSKFKEVTDVSNYDCLKDDFSGLNLKELVDKVASSDTFSPAADAFFKTNEGQTTSPYQSCLLINWKKTTYGDDTNAKWHGKFTWLWTFVRGDEGFINFNVAETHTSEEAKFKFSGVFYLLEKKNSNWEIKHKQEVKENKNSGTSGQDSMFPKKANVLGNDSKPYWDFLDTNGTLDKMCKPSECGASGTEKLEEPKKFTWTFSSTGTHKLKEWSESLEWWKQLYEHSTWDLSTKLLDDFKGTWTSK